MKFDNKNITFSKIDLYRGITLPSELNEDLAYLLGFHLGDGHMRQYIRSFGSLESSIFYDGHSINEYSHYEQYLCPLIRRLFNYICKIEVRKNSNNLRVCIGSRAIVDFLHIQCGLPLGPKDNAGIPSIIKNANKNLQCAFLRGLVDTDGSVVFKGGRGTQRYYPTIDFQMKSKTLIGDLSSMLKSLGFSFHFGSRLKKRYEKAHFSHYIQINGIRYFKMWEEMIGFSSQNHLTRIQVWKKLGYLPPRTTILDRIELLQA